MAVLTAVAVTPVGATPNFVAASGGGDKVAPSARVYLHVRNGGGGSITVTVDDTLSKAPAGATSFNGDLVVTVPAAGEKLIGPLPPERFRGVDGLVAITYSGTTSVTVAAIKV